MLQSVSPHYHRRELSCETFQRCVCHCCCFFSKSSRSCFACGKSCKCTRTGFSHDLFIAREECAALRTAAGELEVPFAGGVSVVWLRCGDSACHQGRPDRGSVIPEDTSSEEPDCLYAPGRAAWREGMFTETAAPPGIGLSGGLWQRITASGN